MNTLKLATYGTLRLNQCNWRGILESSLYIGTFKIKGFKLWTNGHFPYATPTEGASEITVDIFEITEQTLLRTDRLEGYPSHYKRKEVSIGDHLAWIYFRGEEELGEWVQPVPSGDWMDARNDSPSYW